MTAVEMQNLKKHSSVTGKSISTKMRNNCRGGIMKVVKIILICILSLAFVLYILLPAGFGLYASLEKTMKVGQPPDGFNTVQLLAEGRHSIGSLVQIT